MNWINKLTFANMIKSNHNPAADVELIDDRISPTAALEIFKNITEKCDFYNIFGAVQFSDIIPDATWTDLTDYNAFLYENGLSQVPQSVLQSVLENSINQFKRSVNEVFTTPQKLAEILVKAGINDLTMPANNYRGCRMNIQELDATFKRFMYGLLAKATNGDYPEQDYINHCI